MSTRILSRFLSLVDHVTPLRYEGFTKDESTTLKVRIVAIGVNLMMLVGIVIASVYIHIGRPPSRASAMYVGVAMVFLIQGCLCSLGQRVTLLSYMLVMVNLTSFVLFAMAVFFANTTR
jgi:hypothetical protein